MVVLSLQHYGHENRWKYCSDEDREDGEYRKHHKHHKHHKHYYRPVCAYTRKGKLITFINKRKACRDRHVIKYKYGKC